MSNSKPSIIETRHDQIFRHLDATDIERARRFGEIRRFAVGEALAAIGEVGLGLAIILSGPVDVSRYDAHGRRQHLYTFGPGCCSVIPGSWGTKRTAKRWHNRSGSCCDFGRACTQDRLNVRTHLPRPMVVQKIGLQRWESKQQLGSQISKYE